MAQLSQTRSRLPHSSSSSRAWMGLRVMLAQYLLCLPLRLLLMVRLLLLLQQ
jgi:hypothetical protein